MFTQRTQLCGTFTVLFSRFNYVFKSPLWASIGTLFSTIFLCIDLFQEWILQKQHQPGFPPKLNFYNEYYTATLLFIAF